MTDSLPGAANTKNEKWLRGLDSIRFILAFTVLMGHFFSPDIDALKSSPHFILRLLSDLYSIAFDGPAAVIAFFVISGFVIHYPNKGKEINLKQFYIRRYGRVLGPLLVVLFLGLFLGNPEFGVTWSLICELIYYTLYPFIIRIKASLNVKILISVLLYLALMILFTGNNLNSFIHQKDIRYNGNYIYLGVYYTWIVGFPCWLTGVKLAENIDYHTNKPRFSSLMVLRVCSWLAATFCLVTRFHFYLSYIYSLNILCFLFYFWIKYEINYYRYAVPFTWLESWGKFSYSLYLTHVLILKVISLFVVVNLYNYFLVIIVTVFISYLFYLLVEKNSHILAKYLAAKYI